MLKTDCKDAIAQNLRQRISRKNPQIRETDRAELSLCTLSFQSNIFPERQVWIDTEEEEIKIDLEDWQNGDEWDNAIARVTVESTQDAADLVETWLSGGNLQKYSNLNKEYQRIEKASSLKES